MSFQKIVVHNVDQLEQFRDVLLQQHDSLENSYDTLYTECSLQSENWNDPQYIYLKDCIDTYYQFSKAQLTQLEDSTAYITRLIEKLRAI